MTIAIETTRNDYTGDGSTETYSYTFKVFSQADLLVTVRDSNGDETTLTITTDYTVTGVGSTSGGTIVLVNSAQAWLDGDGDLATGYHLTIRRKQELKQSTDIRNQGDFLPEIHENAFDKLTMSDQQQQDEINRSIKLAETQTPAGFTTEFPATTADAMLKVNVANDGLEMGPNVTDMLTDISTALTTAQSAQTDANAAQNTIDAHISDGTGAHAATAISVSPAGSISSTNVQAALGELDTDIQTFGAEPVATAHIADTTDAHTASAITNVPSGNLAATDVQGALDEIQTQVDSLIVGPFTAADITVTPSGNLGSVNAQAALEELQGDIDTNSTGISDHLTDVAGAHAASAITNTPAGNIAATDLQAAINELDGEKASLAYADAQGGITAAHTLVNGETFQLPTGFISLAHGAGFTTSANLDLPTNATLTIGTRVGFRCTGNTTGGGSVTVRKFGGGAFSACPTMYYKWGAVFKSIDNAEGWVIESLSPHQATTNTGNSLVQRDPSGDFAAGTITAALTGVASGNVQTIAKSGATALTGAVTLSEGAGVTITQVGQDIEIASTGGSPAASDVTVNAAGFAGNLSGTDTDVQTALATIDAMTVGGGTGDKLQTDPSDYVSTIKAGEAIAIRDAVCLDLDGDSKYKIFRTDTQKANRRNCIGFATAAATATPNIVTLTLDAALVASNAINMKINGRDMATVTYASSSDATWALVAATLAPAHIQTLTLGGALVASNVVAYKINGTSYSTTYASSSDATLQAIATQIATHTGIASATVTVVGGNQTGTDDRVITITGSDAQEYRFTDISITAGASQTTITMATTQYWSPDILTAVVTVVGGNQTGTDDRVITITGQGALPINITNAAVTGGASQANIAVAESQAESSDVVSFLRDGPLGGFSGLTAGAAYSLDTVPGKIAAIPIDPVPVLAAQAISADTIWAFPVTKPFATPAYFIRVGGGSTGDTITGSAAQADAEHWNYTSWLTGTANTSYARMACANGEASFLGKLWVVDGIDSAANVTAITRSYDKASWITNTGNRTQTRASANIGVLGNLLYTVMGTTGTTYSTPVDKIDTFNGTSWTQLATAWTVNVSVTSCYVIGSRIYTAFGWSNAGGTSTNWHYSFNGSAMQTEASNPVASGGVGGGRGSASLGMAMRGGNFQATYAYNGTSFSALIDPGSVLCYDMNRALGPVVGYNTGNSTLFLNGGSSALAVSQNISKSFNGSTYAASTASSYARTGAVGGVV